MQAACQKSSIIPKEILLVQSSCQVTDDGSAAGSVVGNRTLPTSRVLSAQIGF